VAPSKKDFFSDFRECESALEKWKMIAALPIEIFLIIRSYLVVFDVPEDVDGIHRIIKKEAERSWRSFLVVNRGHSSIRRETMIWSLNKFAFKTYSEDEPFRQYLHGRMACPAQQLQFQSNRSCIAKYCILEFIRTSSIEFISIYDNDLVVELPSSSRLRVLKMSRVNIMKIGDYPNLKTLVITRCKLLESVGKMIHLQNLVLSENVEKPDVAAEQLLLQFPLEQIQKLKIDRISETFFTLSHRFTGLKSLHFAPSCEARLSLRGELFPSLIELHASYFDSVHLTGMVSLQHLEILHTLNNQIYGDEEIFSQLKSFSYTCFGNKTFDESFLSVLKNVHCLTLHTFTTLTSDFLDSMSKNVTSLDLNMKRNEVTVPNRLFKTMKLFNCNFCANFSVSKLQILSLNRCLSITDISPFKDIPYLELLVLPEVRDFSSIGNQRYLAISKCLGLSDEAMSGFGNVFHLRISDCDNITEVRNLQDKNKFLFLSFCRRLKSVELSNQDYIYVNINRITLDNFKILGRVYSLDFTLNERWTRDMIPRKYQYLNGEEIASELLAVKQLK
jgi:hypothetical protein